MEMYFCPLYSGSSGNALFCQYGHTRLLIDAGKPGKTISDALSRIGVAMETISGVLITHEHSDHIAGAGVLARKYHMPLYATRGTWEGIGDKIGRVDPELRLEIAAGQDFYLGDIGVEPFSIPHDAADPVGFRVWYGAHSAATATDMGCARKSVIKALAGVDVMVLESNHDPDLLRMNPHYSLYLKQRILSNRGHLSNQASADVLLQLMESGVREVLLGHLSSENNTPELAMRTHEDTLVRQGVKIGTDIDLGIAWRDRVSRKFEIE